MLLRNQRVLDGDLEGEADTVAYSGPHLAELLAASGERPALDELEIAIETTVVMSGSRTRSLRPSVPPERAAVDETAGHAASNLAASDSDPSCSVNIGAVAYTLSQPVIADPPRRGIGRYTVALTLAAAGIVVGVLFARPSLSGERFHASRALSRQAEKHDLVAETIPLVSPTLQKVAPKKLARVPCAASRSSGGVAGSVVTSRRHEPNEDGPTQEDLHRALAARLERPL